MRHLPLFLLLTACATAGPTGKGNTGADAAPDTADPDTGTPCTPRTWYADADADGFGSDDAVEACEPPDGHVGVGGDCADDDPRIHPDATEVCDGIDDDCDGDIDEGALDEFWEDADGDGYGAGDPTLACEATEGRVDNADDCDDTRADWNVGEWDCRVCTDDQGDKEWPALDVVDGWRVICSEDHLVGLSGDDTAWGDDFVLLVDLDMSGHALVEPIGRPGAPFTGRLQGADHAISNLRIDSTAHDRGLFGVAEGATLERLTLADVDIAGRYRVGALVGSGSSLDITDVAVSGTVHGTYPAGGIVGGLEGGTLRRVSFSGDMTGNNESSGGIVGDALGVDIEDASVVLTAVQGQALGGVVGVAEELRVAGCTVDLISRSGDTSRDVTGGVVGTARGIVGMQGCDVTVDIESEGGRYLGGVVGSSSAELTVHRVSVGGRVSGAGRLGGAIAYSPAASTWTELEVDVDVTGGGRSGGFVGQATDLSAADVVVLGDVVGVAAEGSYTAELGGFGGLMEGGTFTDITVSGDVDAGVSQFVGGYMGASSGGTHTGIHASGAVTVDGSRDYAGGLVGVLSGSLSDCTASGAVSAPGVRAVGGLVGINSANIEDCSASGAVTGGASVGGLIGGNAGDLARVSASGDVVGADTRVGGLAGYSTGSIEDGVAEGDVQGGDVVGGFVGRHYSGATTVRSRAHGDVTATDDAGGFVSLNWASTIEDCYSTGAATGGSRVGGFASYAYTGAFSRTYATGLASGGTQTGGFVGQLSQGSSVRDSFAAGGTAGSTGTAGDFSGGGTGLDNCWLAAPLAQGDCSSADAADLQVASNPPLDAWDFTSVWAEVAGGYPELR